MCNTKAPGWVLSNHNLSAPYFWLRAARGPAAVDGPNCQGRRPRPSFRDLPAPHGRPGSGPAPARDPRSGTRRAVRASRRRPFHGRDREGGEGPYRPRPCV